MGLQSLQKLLSQISEADPGVPTQTDDETMARTTTPIEAPATDPSVPKPLAKGPITTPPPKGATKKLKEQLPSTPQKPPPGIEDILMSGLKDYNIES